MERVQPGDPKGKRAGVVGFQHRLSCTTQPLDSFGVLLEAWGRLYPAQSPILKSVKAMGQTHNPVI